MIKGSLVYIMHVIEVEEKSSTLIIIRTKRYIRISSFLFSELRQDSIEEEEIIFMLFDFFAVHGKIKSKGL
jgi:hypothetical protein